MDQVLRPQCAYAAAYLEHIVVRNADWSSHLVRLEGVLNALRETGLTANPKKYYFSLEEAN